MKHAAIDLRLRREMPAGCRELLEAYEAATSRMVTLDYFRVNILLALYLRDVTMDDIWTVARYVRRLIRTGANKNKVGTFTPASLEMVNLLGDTSRFCDRLQTAREELVSKRIRKGRLVPATVQVSERDSITRLVPEAERAPESARALVAAALRGILSAIEAPMNEFQAEEPSQQQKRKN